MRTNTIPFTLAVRYHQLPFDTMPRPYIEATLSHGSNRLPPIPGLVDSGADRIYCHTTYARELHLTLDPADQATLTGVGGQAPVWLFNLQLSVLGKRFPARVGFSPGVSESYCILGREGFFDTFLVALDNPGQQILLYPWSELRRLGLTVSVRPSRSG